MVLAWSAVGPVTTSGAHPMTSFEACAAYSRATPTCVATANYVRGETVYLRGKVRPVHAGAWAAVLHRDPGSNVWMRLGQVRVSDFGKMRWEWKTTREDVDQHDPYIFRFKITGHGRSNKVRVWVVRG
jgi:hypothetical protein